LGLRLLLSESLSPGLSDSLSKITLLYFLT